MGSHNIHMSSMSWIETSVKTYMFVKPSFYKHIVRSFTWFVPKVSVLIFLRTNW
jgi:hypothetical protein